MDLSTQTKLIIIEILPNSPNDNVIVVRFHFTILQHLRILKLRNKKQHHYKSYALQPYINIINNRSLHSFIQCPPYYIITGYFYPRDTVDIDFSKHRMQQYVQNHSDQMKLIYETLSQTIQTKICTKYNIIIQIKYNIKLYNIIKQIQIYDIN